MKSKYYILTIVRNGEQKTIVGELNLIRFLLIEQELAYTTTILYSQEITKEEYDYYSAHKKQIRLLDC